MPSFLETISPEPMRRALAGLIDSDAATRVQLYLLGQDRLLQWAHSVGVATNDVLRAAVSPVPPHELRRLDTATEEPLYLWTGLTDITNFFAIYQQLGAAHEDRKPRVLDFGCDSGRLARYLNMHEGVEPFAVDANPRQVEWCQLNLDRVVTLLQAGRQNLPFPDAMFDFVYAMTLFTGADHSRWQRWFDEITRVMSPGGLLLAITFGPTALTTIHGSPAHQAMYGITAARAAEMLQDLPAEGSIHVPYGVGAATPDRIDAGDGFTFVHPEYPAEHWNAGSFEVLQHIPGGLRGWQDIVVLRRKQSEPVT